MESSLLLWMLMRRSMRRVDRPSTAAMRLRPSHNSLRPVRVSRFSILRILFEPSSSTCSAVSCEMPVMVSTLLLATYSSSSAPLSRLCRGEMLRISLYESSSRRRFLKPDREGISVSWLSRNSTSSTTSLQLHSAHAEMSVKRFWRKLTWRRSLSARILGSMLFNLLAVRSRALRFGLMVTPSKLCRWEFVKSSTSSCTVSLEGAVASPIVAMHIRD
mmetsp:Transcript_4993/g.10773  ORF Transcript_4993/g.10773 Transcript_4993/m.10773 type:complete len:217 (-) Transcript_4993:8-658(-)